MNVGQVLEFTWAGCQGSGFQSFHALFDGASFDEIVSELEKAYKKNAYR
jgi:DNA-directed RNA polymerase beta subunit